MIKGLFFIVPGKVQAKARPRFSRQGNKVRTYTPDQTTKYEDLVRAHFAEAVSVEDWPLDWHYRLSVVAYSTVPTSYPKWRKELIKDGTVHPTVKPDWDNVGKIVSDALNGHAWLDDSQVVDARVVKRYCPYDRPRLEITIEAYCDIRDRWLEVNE